MQCWTEHHYTLSRTDSLFLYAQDDFVSLRLDHYTGEGTQGFEIEFTTAQLPEIRGLYLELEAIALKERLEQAAPAPVPAPALPNSTKKP